jgi:hypothetical protein
MNTNPAARRPLTDGMFLTVVILVIAAVAVVVLPQVRKLIITKAMAVLSQPELKFNPHGEVVQVFEADGKSFTKASDPYFNERVKRIKQDGRYDKTFTGRLDGKP